VISLELLKIRIATTDGALPVLFGDLAVKQLPHLCLGAEFTISPGVVRVFDTLHPEVSDSTSFLDQVATTARKGLVDGQNSLRRSFIGFLQAGFSGKSKTFDFPVCLRLVASLPTPEPFGCALVNWRMCAAW
jgi:hypothetical protein